MPENQGRSFSCEEILEIRTKLVSLSEHRVQPTVEKSLRALSVNKPISKGSMGQVVRQTKTLRKIALQSTEEEWARVVLHGELPTMKLSRGEMEDLRGGLAMFAPLIVPLGIVAGGALVIGGLTYVLYKVAIEPAWNGQEFYPAPQRQ